MGPGQKDSQGTTGEFFKGRSDVLDNEPRGHDIGGVSEVSAERHIKSFGRTIQWGDIGLGIEEVAIDAIGYNGHGLPVWMGKQIPVLCADDGAGIKVVRHPVLIPDQSAPFLSQQGPFPYRCLLGLSLGASVKRIHDVEDVGYLVKVLYVFSGANHLGQQHVGLFSEDVGSHPKNQSALREKENLKWPTGQRSPNHSGQCSQPMETINSDVVTSIIEGLYVLCGHLSEA